MSSTTPEPLDASFQISLPSFEGPLDLLLHLIRKHELEILDLPIAFVTERYLAYVTMMEQLDLDIASEYLVMAATLAHIKSKMLLPQEPEDQGEDDTPEDEIDPRAELIKRLLEYQKYKDVAERLGARGIAGRDVFLRGSDAPEASGPTPLAPTSLFRLLDAFQGVLERAKADAAFEITTEGLSIQDRMRELTDLLREKRELTFEMLFEGQVTIVDLVVTFMALLEMAKRRLVRIYQADPHSPIHLRSTVLSEDEEGYATESWDDEAEGGGSEEPESDESEPSSPAGEPRATSGAHAPEASDDDLASDDLASDDLSEEWDDDEPPSSARPPEPDWTADYAAWDVRADTELAPGEEGGIGELEVDENEDAGLSVERFGEDEWTAPDAPRFDESELESTESGFGEPSSADAEAPRTFDERDRQAAPHRVDEGDDDAATRPHSFDESEAETTQHRVDEGGDDAAARPHSFDESEAETTQHRVDEDDDAATRPRGDDAEAEAVRTGADDDATPRRRVDESDAETTPRSFDAGDAATLARSEERSARGADADTVAVREAVAVTDEAADRARIPAERGGPRPDETERDAGSLALDPDAGSGKQSHLADSDEDEDEPT